MHAQHGLVVLALLLPAVAIGQPDSALYATSVVEHSLAIPPAALDSEQATLLRWLQRNGGRIMPGQGPALREHIYLLIDNRARQMLAQRGTVVPSEPDTGLARLFDGASRLGLFGASLVTDSLLRGAPAGTFVPAAPANAVDAPLTLTYAPPYYTVAAPDVGWRVRFSYYFMITGVAHRQLAPGVMTDAVFLSTLWGTHSSGLTPPSGARYSQATIILLSASRADSAAFVTYWRGSLGFPSGSRVADTLVAGGESYRARDEAAHLEKECVIVAVPRGVLLIAYIGLPGTFDDNRPHFLSLLTSLQK